MSVLFGLAAGAAMVTNAQDNLLPDPEFKQADFKPLAEKTTWRWYQINAPSEAKVEGAAVSMTGGKTFLHSSRFAVTPDQSYQISLKAQGKGKVSIESLWWAADGSMTKPHRTFAVKPMDVTEAAQDVAGADTAPKEAKEAYIRVVVEEGTVTVSAPKVVVAPKK